MLLHLQPSHGTACRNWEQIQSLTILCVIFREKLQDNCREGEGAALVQLHENCTIAKMLIWRVGKADVTHHSHCEMQSVCGELQE